MGDVAPIYWTYSGALIGPLTLQYDTSGTVNDGSPEIATEVNKTGVVPGSYTYNWTIPAQAESGTVKVRVKDTPRPNSRGDSNTNFTVIPVSTIAVVSPINASEFSVGQTADISWTVRGLSVDNLTIEYWDDANQNNIVDGTEVLLPVASGINRGTSDTADPYSGRYTGSYTWTIPDDALVSSTLKVKVSDPAKGYAAVSQATSVS